MTTTPWRAAARDAYVLNMGLRRDADDPTASGARSRTATPRSSSCSTCARSAARAGRIISNAQMNWLKRGLSNSRPTSRSSSPPSRSPTSRARRPAPGRSRTSGASCSTIKNLQQNGKKGFFFLAGDVHFSAAGSVNAPGTDFGDINEFVIGPLGNRATA